MKYKNIFDCHTHSVNSFDGNHKCDELCKSVIEKGGIGLAITDHCDIDGNDFDLDRQFNNALDVENKYKDIIVLKGIELGQGIYRKEQAEKELNSRNYDIVIGSIHNLENMEDFYFLDYKKYNVHELLTDYFNAILEMVKWNNVDTVAHLTYPLRYIVAREHINVDLSKYYNIIDEIFKALIDNDKALELNVSGLFMDINDTLPSKELIKRFHDMGGKYVTVGTDSHFKEKVCVGIDKGYDILLECGYDKFTIFKNRKPILIDIM